MQNQQLTAIRSALEQQAKAMAELGQARTMDELMAVQNQMTALSQVQSQIAQAPGGRAAGR